jgi:hypothetical protein
MQQKLGYALLQYDFLVAMHREVMNEYSRNFQM